MFSSGRRSFRVRQAVVVDVGCSCRQARKLSSLFTSRLLKRKAKPNHSPKHHDHQPLSSQQYSYYGSSTATTVATSPWETSHHASSSISTTTPTSTYGDDTPSPHSRATWARKEKADTQKKSTRAVGESVAVVKESDDPYHDFRESMLQMITENEIYAWDGLTELLSRFLALNSPHHHGLIVSAFTEIWNGGFSSSSSSAYPSRNEGGAAAAYCKQRRPRGHRAPGGGRRRRQLSRDARVGAGEKS